MRKLIIGISCFIVIGSITTIFLFKKSNNETKENQPDEPQQDLPKEYAMDYKLENDQLLITYDGGKDWIKVPVEKEALFAGEFNGSQQELIDDSYILTKDRALFLSSIGSSWDDQSIILTYSLDQGVSWKETVVTEQIPAIRFRKVAFLNDRFGYVIISGGRTMSSELSNVYLTHDGGETWHITKNSDVTRLIADGGFVDEKTGFLSYGTINPEKPTLFVTEDAGNSWAEAKINIPEQYDRVFVIAETPVKEGDHLSVLINQGPNGDYAGGNVKGKFLSKDNGKSWEFSAEVNPSETE